MDSSLFTYLLVGVIGVLGFLLVEEKYFSAPPEGTLPDTVYVDRPFKVETVTRADAIIPELVTVYQTEQITVERIELLRDTVRVFVDSSLAPPIIYNSAFLTAFPYAPKFLEATLSDDRISFTGLTPSGQTRTGQWPVDLERRTYRIAPDGQGWVGLESQRSGGWFGLDLEFSQAIGAGGLWRLDGGEFKQDVYVYYNPRLQLFPGFSIEGQAWLSSRPFGAVGAAFEL